MTESERCRFFDGGVCLHEKFEGATEVSDLFCAQCLDRLPMKKWLGPVPETNHRSLRDRMTIARSGPGPRERSEV